MEKYAREYHLNELIDKYKQYDDNEEHIAIITKAYEYAKESHKSSHRLSGEAYINHPLRVALILTDLYIDQNTIAATLLHEVITEEKKTIEEIKQEFGDEIADLVQGVTKISRLNFTAADNSAIKSQRKIFVGLAENVNVIFIKLADRLDNMRTLDALPVNEQKQKAKETLEILIPIAHRLGLNNLKSELEELSLKYLKRDAYDDVVYKLAKSKDERDKAVLQMKEELIEILENANLKYEIKGRSKSIYSIYKKLDKGRSFKDIYDLLALRILIEKEQDCYMLLGLIHSKYKYIPSRFKDYIAMPKNNMYQSLHTTVFGTDGNIFEIQIRTFEMNDIAEHGIASHWSYKEGGGNKVLHSMEQKLALFRKLIESNEDSVNPEELLDTVKEELLSEDIFVYTPNGDVIELKRGSTPIDFAYRVHSKVAEAMIGAIVNNNIVPLSYELESGDIVKINTAKNPTGPKIEWLNIVKTNQARDKIKNYFTKAERQTSIEKGEELLQKELRKRKMDFSVLTDSKTLNELLSELKLKDLNDLYNAVGSNHMTPGFIINSIIDENETKEELILKKVMNAESKDITIKKDIIVEGIDEIKANLAKCCMPVYGDNIIGYITKGDGITVHRSDCPNITQSDRLIDVRWNPNTKKKYKAIFQVETLKTENGLINIINKAPTSDINIESVNTTDKIDTIIYEMTALTYNKDDLEKYMSTIKGISFVERVERIIK